MKPHIVVLTGAGISAESGLKTFRDSGGLWENHRIEDVATPEAWHRNRALVLQFYNERRKAMHEAKPNAGHLEIAAWQKHARVSVITQNVDDLHERAGSKSVLHLHGELAMARSTADPNLILPVKGWAIREGDVCPLGSQLRPHIVWFGEAVTEMPYAEEIAATADVLVVVGTSLQVYPAASLAWSAPDSAHRFLVDPHPPTAPDYEILPHPASIGLGKVSQMLGFS